MKIGIFGGTFNPPHKTHLNMAHQAMLQLSLNKLLVFPCGDPPHKKPDIDKQIRLQLTQIAFADVEGCVVDDFELNKVGKSYTLDTVKYVRALYPKAQIFLVIGEDSLRDFDSWYKSEEILQLATLAVCERGGVDGESMKAKLRNNLVTVNFEPNDVSSTEIRLRYIFGLPNSQFVTDNVDKFIKDFNVYGQKAQVVEKVRQYITDDKRFEHTYYVVKRGLQICPSNLKEQTFWACLLHDVAKNLPAESYAKYGFVAGDMPKPILHAFLGELVAKQDFAVTDQEVLSAIKYHCTAKANMSPLDMVVYVADKTEETRPFPTDHLLKGNLKDMFIACLLEANDHCVTAHGDQTYYLTRQAIDFYTSGA